MRNDHRVPVFGFSSKRRENGKIEPVIERPSQKEAEEAVRVLIRYVGDYEKRDGLLKTPERVCRSLMEMTNGINLDPADILKTTFEDKCDEMVVLTDISFTSLCEHHLLPFTGHASIGYIPNKRVVGISKLSRLVTCVSKRLQLQERITHQITNLIMENLRPFGCGAVLEAHHACMSCRGVHQQKSQMVTSSMLGVFRTDHKVREEFLNLRKGR
jgi:GTP cyclohydrolase I